MRPVIRRESCVRIAVLPPSHVVHLAESAPEMLTFTSSDFANSHDAFLSSGWVTATMRSASHSVTFTQTAFPSIR